jgi:hypothetical protein
MEAVPKLQLLEQTLNLGEKPGFRSVFPRVCPKPTGFWNKLNELSCPEVRTFLEKI